MPSPYSLPEFISIASNKARITASPGADEILRSYEPLFNFMDKLPSTFYFVHDFSIFRYILLSKSVKTIMGYDIDKVLNSDFGQVLKEYLHPEEVNPIRLIHQEFFDFLYKLPVEERYRHRFDFNFRLRRTSGEWAHILQQTVFIALTKEGHPLYDFSTCTDITSRDPGGQLRLAIHRQNNENLYETVHQYHVNSNAYNLSPREIEIVKLTAQGFSSKEIAGRLCRSFHTIAKHKKNILAKTGSRSLPEVVGKLGLFDQTGQKEV